MNKYNVRELLSKKPKFYRSVFNPYTYRYNMPKVSQEGVKGTGGSDLPKITIQEVTQDEFIEELNPQSHLIFDQKYYPDRKLTEDGTPAEIALKNNPDATVIIKPVARVAINEQGIIADRQKIHLFGGNIEFSLHKGTDGQLTEFKKAWKFFRMKDVCLEVADSAMKTGDGAAHFFFDKKKRLKYEVWSYRTGSSMAMHKECFTRYFKEDGHEYVWLFDDTNKYVYEMSDGDWKLDGKAQKHGFTEIPIAYKKIDDVAWGEVQPLADMLERSISDLRESNSHYGLSMLFLKGGGIDVLPNKSAQGVILEGDKESEAKLLEGQGKAESFAQEIRILTDKMYRGSGTSFIDLEMIKGGDPSGTFVRLLFSDSTQKAMENIPVWNDFVEKLKDITMEAVGLVEAKVSDYAELQVSHTIEPYVPQSDAEITQNLAMGVASKFLSRQTASEHSKYGTPNEAERIRQEQEDDKKLELSEQEEL